MVRSDRAGRRNERGASGSDQPSRRALYAHLNPNTLPIDPCSIEASLITPVLRFFIPIHGAFEPVYQVFATRLIAGDLQPDVAVDGFQIDFLSSVGGAPDDIGPFVSVCDLSCNTTGGREE